MKNKYQDISNAACVTRQVLRSVTVRKNAGKGAQ